MSAIKRYTRIAVFTIVVVAVAITGAITARKWEKNDFSGFEN